MNFWRMTSTEHQYYHTSHRNVAGIVRTTTSFVRVSLTTNVSPVPKVMGMIEQHGDASDMRYDPSSTLSEKNADADILISRPILIMTVSNRLKGIFRKFSHARSSCAGSRVERWVGLRPMKTEEEGL
jgi:hypothetical protein